MKSEKENSDEDKLESDQTESGKMNPSQMFAKDDQYGIMSRIARNSTPSFIWTLKRDDIDFKYLRKDQIVNHYISAWAFTTKSGLSTNLRNVHYFEDTTSNTFFPRCYRLCCDDEKHSFVDDYRITATQGILKVLIKNCYEWRKIEHLKNNANHRKKENAQEDEDNDIQKGITETKPNLLRNNYSFQKQLLEVFYVKRCCSTFIKIHRKESLF